MSNAFVLRNADDARALGKTLPFKVAIGLINEFKEFNPFHILPTDRARKYLDENWEGRLLDLQHFGINVQQRPEKQ